MILISNDFWHKIKMYNFDSYTVLLAISTNVLFMTAFVLQGRGLLPDPNPRVPKYFRVSGRVSG